MSLPPDSRELVMEVELDAAPEKVWRALSIPAFREQWLPAADLSGEEPLRVCEPEHIAFVMRESQPPHLSSTVSFELRPNGQGGTTLTIVHTPQAANEPCMRLAA